MLHWTYFYNNDHLRHYIFYIKYVAWPEIYIMCNIGFFVVYGIQKIDLCFRFAQENDTSWPKLIKSELTRGGSLLSKFFLRKEHLSDVAANYRTFQEAPSATVWN